MLVNGMWMEVSSIDRRVAGARRLFVRKAFAHYVWIGAAKSGATWVAYILAVDVAGFPAWASGIFIAGLMFVVSWLLMIKFGVIA